MEGSDVAAENKVKQEAKLQLEQVFTPEMAYIAYVPLCRLIGKYAGLVINSLYTKTRARSQEQ